MSKRDETKYRAQDELMHALTAAIQLAEEREELPLIDGEDGYGLT